jgi:polar amino acid transport system permease protein
MRSTTSRTSSPATDGQVVKRGLLTVAVVGGTLAFLLLAPQRYHWNWAGVWRDSEYASYMLGGLLLTLWISLGAMVVALVLGVLGGVARLSQHWFWNQLGTIYVEVIRGTPLLVQIIIAYFCFASATRDLLASAGAPTSILELTGNGPAVGIVVLGIFGGAYVTEIVRAAILSIDRGQTEAALSQGMSRRQVFRHVLFPQALRRMIPPMTGQFANLIKDSSLLSVVAVVELTKRAGEVRANTYQTYEVFIPLAAMYLAICFPLSWLSRRLELRLAD